MNTTHSPVKKAYEKYMLVMGILGQLGLYIQALRIYTARSAENVSLLAFLCILISLISWMIYGVILRNRALITSNIFAIMGAVLVVTGIFLYS